MNRNSGNQKYYFTTPKSSVENYMYNPTIQNKITIFYQVCVFKNPWTHKYHIRKFVLNANNEFVEIKDYQLTEKIYKKFTEGLGQHKHKYYSTYSLDDIAYPHMSEILTAQSELFTNETDYFGFAKI